MVQLTVTRLLAIGVITLSLIATNVQALPTADASPEPDASAEVAATSPEISSANPSIDTESVAKEASAAVADMAAKVTTLGPAMETKLDKLQTATENKVADISKTAEEMTENAAMASASVKPFLVATLAAFTCVRFII
ncbi:hypothetical protein RDWZM_004670 [Blomia tropicalis]|uniref:Uncharacterized protein n=1 Tax=Blomia tropicalis TaxID=40697 RepID=A0A9Q0RK76_BLOTA|nr:hypothetical protein BLOT_014973 [Blomia tropicalis]KAJ6218858.1 hypothetical protein RDWZM_004670 [Blomia tropicalis]